MIKAETQLNFVKDARSTVPRHGSRVWRKRKLEQIRGLVWHQTLGTGTAEQVARYHVAPNHISDRGLPSISYTFFIERNGDVLLCNDLEDITYSQGDRTKPGDENVMYLAAAFGGDFDAPGYSGSMQPTVWQLQAGLRLWLACRDVFGWNSDRLLGHHHFGKSVCPGTVLSQLIDAVQADTTDNRNERRRPTAPNLNTTFGRQDALFALGYYDGPLDGIWGMASRRALAAYQKDRGLKVDGIWGPQTAAAVYDDVG